MAVLIDYSTIPTYPSKDISDINNYFSTNNFFIMNYNIRSIRKHFDEFSLLLDRLTFQPTVIGLTETQLNTNIPFNLQNYNAHHFLHEHTTHDSISIFVHKIINHYSVSQIQFNSCNAAELDFELNGETFSVLVIYRSPSLNPEHFVLDLQNYLSNSKQRNYSFIIGDININTLHLDKTSNAYLEKLLENGYMSIINSPTRFESMKPACQDHIMYKSLLGNNVRGATLNFHSTDHIPTFLELDLPLTQGGSPAESHVTKKEINYPALLESLATESWDEVYQLHSPSDGLDKFYTILDRHIGANTCTTVVSNKFRKLKPWMTHGLLKSIRRRDALYKKYVKHKKDCLRRKIFGKS